MPNKRQRVGEFDYLNEGFWARARMWAKEPPNGVSSPSTDSEWRQPIIYTWLGVSRVCSRFILPLILLGGAAVDSDRVSFCSRDFSAVITRPLARLRAIYLSNRCPHSFDSPLIHSSTHSSTRSVATVDQPTSSSLRSLGPFVVGFCNFPSS